MNQIENIDSSTLRARVSDGDVRLERITRSILKSIKDVDSSSAGGVRADTIKKIINDELKKDKSE